MGLQLEEVVAILQLMVLSQNLRGSSVRVNLSAFEILKLAKTIIAKSKLVHDTIALLSLDKVVCKASGEAERMIDTHVLSCSKREDVYRLVKAKADWIGLEGKRYVQSLVQAVSLSDISMDIQGAGSFFA
ncbi:hypothetical protein ACFE04_014981 [Oxalis oulophora]